MSHATLNATTTGQGLSQRPSPAPGWLDPAVVYGEGVEPLPIAVEAKSFRTAVSGEQGINSLIELDATARNSSSWPVTSSVTRCAAPSPTWTSRSSTPTNRGGRGSATHDR